MYNINFDIAAIVLAGIVSLLHIFHKDLKTRTYYIIRTEMILVFFTPIVDILSIWFYLHGYSEILFNIVNSIFYCNRVLISFFFLLFILEKTHDFLSFNFIRKIILCAPMLFYIGLLLANPFTHCLWTYIPESKLYLEGSLWYAFIIIPIAYFALSYIYILLNIRNFNLYMKVVTNAAIIINIATVTLELIFPYIMFYSFGFSIALALFYICTLSTNVSIDDYSGIPNLHYYVQQIHKLAMLKRSFTTIFVRIADFELFLSTYGYDKAKLLMQEIAKNMVKEFAVEEVYELNTNYFAVIITEPEKKHEYELRIKAILDKKYYIGDSETAFSYFISGVNYPTEARTLDELTSYGHFIERMSRKRYGIVPTSELTLRDTVREKAVEQAIERALKNNSFYLNYQPIYNIQLKKFTTAEALIRLNDPILGYISPAEFIPIAERNGSIIRIGNFIMKEVFKFLSEQELDKLGIHYIELNLSTIQCLQRNFMDTLYENLKDYHVDPHNICFEITETASNCAPEIFTENIANLSKGGYKLAIDDYGTGYANFNRLIEGYFSIVKFDKGTTEQICKQDDKIDIFKRLVLICHTMGYHIVAEGVEEQAQIDFLYNLGIDYIQGYYYSKPLSHDDYIEFLKKYNN